MSSSSDTDGATVPIPVKRVKRRRCHRITDLDAEEQKVNLYSRKILPKLDALAKSPIKLKAGDEDEGNDCVPFNISPTVSPQSSQKSHSGSPEKTVTPPKINSPDSSTVIPPTPPPPFNPSKSNRRGSRKAKKLLNEVSTVLSQVSNLDSANDSIVLDDAVVLVKTVTVKVRLRGRLQRFPIEEDQSFDDIFDKLAKKEKVDKARLLVTFGERRIFPSDTPYGIQLTIADILECVVAHRRLPPDVKDTIKIQMQGPFQKKKVPFTMGKDEPFKAVMQEYAEKNDISMHKLKFRFDGEPLEPMATPNSLELDNGDCIDVMHLT